MNCIIIEDQPPAQRLLKKYIEDMGTLQLRGCFPDAIRAMEVLKREEIDLIFLDIHLPKISGIDFLKTLANPPSIILTTAFPDYALESYEFDVVDYLLKPYSFLRFVKAVAKVPLKNQINDDENASTPASKDLFIKSGYAWIKVTIDDIFYIRSDTDYTEIFLAHKKHLSTHTLQYWQDQLLDLHFLRIHKSYLVNGAKIQKLASNQVYLSPEMILPIGRVYKEELMKKLVK